MLRGVPTIINDITRYEVEPLARASAKIGFDNNLLVDIFVFFMILISFFNSLNKHSEIIDIATRMAASMKDPLNSTSKISLPKKPISGPKKAATIPLLMNMAAAVA